MPRTGQIIPDYLVTHVATYINDNSIFTDAANETNDDRVRLLCVFMSAKGEDGVVKTMNNLNDYLEEYGNPNYKIYGQPGYMPYAALQSGNARCFCMRVMPDTATYANIVICAYTKSVVDTVTGNTIFTVKFVAKPIENLTDKAAILVKMEEMAILSPDVDDHGYNVFPLFAVASKGRGVYGNGYHIRVVSDSLMNADNDYMNYIVEVLDSTGGTIIRKEQHRGGFNYDAIIDNASLFIDDIIDDPDAGSAKIKMVTSQSGFDNLYAAYAEALASATTTVTVPTIDNSNIFTGLTKTGANMPNYTVDTSATDSIALDSTIGVSLVGGDDSTFAANYTSTIVEGVPTITRQAAIDAEYIKAFKGDIDRSIRSKHVAPAEIILDANYSEEVKIAMVECAMKRYDARCVIDAGILTTATAAITWVNKPTIKAISDCIVSKECQHYKIRDPFSGRAIPMTATYFIAENLPTHYNTFGNHIPFVGEGYALVANHIRNSMKPVIDAGDNEIREQLYTNHCNFFEYVGEDKIVRATQGTSQTTNSDLSEESNVAVLLDMKRKLEEFVASNLYQFAETEERVRFTEDATRLFSEYRGNKIRSYDISFDMNTFEEQRSILHCYLSVVFRSIAKRGIIEIDINKRA